MSKYLFIKIKDPDNHFDATDVKFRIETEDRKKLIEEFTLFLKACGFQVSELDEVEKEE